MQVFITEALPAKRQLLLSTAVLESSPGEILQDKPAVFRDAEATLRKRREAGEQRRRAFDALKNTVEVRRGCSCAYMWVAVVYVCVIVCVRGRRGGEESEEGRGSHSSLLGRLRL